MKQWELLLSKCGGDTTKLDFKKRPTKALIRKSGVPTHIRGKVRLYYHFLVFFYVI